MFNRSIYNDTSFVIIKQLSSLLVIIRSSLSNAIENLAIGFLKLIYCTLGLLTVFLNSIRYDKNYKYFDGKLGHLLEGSSLVGHT